jgi:hypothetical protein
MTDWLARAKAAALAPENALTQPPFTDTTPPAMVSEEVVSVLSVPVREISVAAWAAGIASLQAECPPPDVPARQWEALVVASRNFIASKWPPVALLAGWTTIDLFGALPTRPSSIPFQGALWFVGAGRILGISATTMSIVTSRGAKQSLRRYDQMLSAMSRSEIVPAWSLQRLVTKSVA